MVVQLLEHFEGVSIPPSLPAELIDQIYRNIELAVRLLNRSFFIRSERLAGSASWSSSPTSRSSLALDNRYSASSTVTTVALSHESNLCVTVQHEGQR